MYVLLNNSAQSPLKVPIVMSLHWFYLNSPKPKDINLIYIMKLN